ncbi:hypothetical protein VO63_36730, partial [Streptomyces showdoensis]
MRDPWSGPPDPTDAAPVPPAPLTGARDHGVPAGGGATGRAGALDLGAPAEPAGRGRAPVPVAGPAGGPAAYGPAAGPAGPWKI